jgi:RNA polymerase sigma-70 factor, ECF subfamily
MKTMPPDMASALSQADLTQAIDAARAGAEWAWTLIYDELAGSVLGYLRGLGAHEPDDLTGEVFLQAVRDLARFEGSAADFRAWIFTIAHHRFLDERRRTKRRPVDPAPDDVITEKLPPVDTGAETEALRSLADQQVRRIIEGLVPAQREVMLMRILGGLTIDEIAGALGKRPGAVKALQRRAIEAIRRSHAATGETGTDRGVPI